MAKLGRSLLIFVAWQTLVQAQAIWRAAELWQDFPGESELRVYIFNVTNPTEFLANPKTVKPSLEEVGPYVYRILNRKTEVSQQFDDLSAKFRQQKFYAFDPAASAPLTEVDEFNIVNLQLLIYGTRLAAMNIDSEQIEWLTEDEGEAMIRRNTVRDVMFGGMDSEKYVRFEEYLGGLLNGPNAPQGFEEFEDGRYSYFKNKQGKDYGEVRVQTAAGSGYGGIITLDRQDSLPFWNDVTCNGIGGTSDGFVFPPSSGDSGPSPSMLFAYLPELCRAVMLNKVHDAYEYEGTGVPGTPYMLGDSFLNYSREHDCWCTDPADVSAVCMPDGALDIQSCSFGAPYAISQPRFRNAHPSYSESVNWVGLGVGDEVRNPSPGDEPTYWVVETKSGTVLYYKRRFQLNIRVGAPALKEASYFKDFPEILFPVLWTEETYRLDAMSFQSLKAALALDDGLPGTSTQAPTPTTTAAPIDNGLSADFFKFLRDDIHSLAKQMLFSTLGILLVLVAILVMSFLTFGLHRRVLGARDRAWNDSTSSNVTLTQTQEPIAITKS